RLGEQGGIACIPAVAEHDHHRAAVDQPTPIGEEGREALADARAPRPAVRVQLAQRLGVAVAAQRFGDAAQVGGKHEALLQPAGIEGAEVLLGAAGRGFSAFDSGELEEIERIARRIARRLAARPSRRWKPSPSGPRVDLRRTLRRATAGELIDLRRRRRKPRKTRIVALCDVSGSMDLYSRFLLQFLYALQGSVARVESFVFSTDLRRITEALRGHSYAEALRELDAHG